MTVTEPASPGGERADDDKQPIDALIRHLWRPDPGGARPEVFLLLDAARDRRIRTLLRRSKVDAYCLFIGDLHPRLASSAPYLLHLGRRSAFSRALIEQAWGNSWGLFVTSRQILQDLRRHFRKILQVRDETGRRYFFRFYDPRVLRVYLPTCSRRELKQVFGPVDRFSMESDNGARLFDFALRGGRLETTTTALPRGRRGGAPPPDREAGRDD